MSRWGWLLLLGSLGGGLLSAAVPPNDGFWHAGDAPGTVLVSYRPALAASELKAEAMRLGLDPLAPLDKIQGALNAQVNGQVDLAVPELYLQRVRLGLSTEAAVNAAILSFRSSPLVRAAEPDHPTQQALAAPNDPYYATGKQWYLSSTDWARAYDAFASASPTVTLQAQVIVAVIDTGVDSTHVELAGQLLASKNFVTAEANTDTNGHGSFCAGLIAAKDDNGVGIAGAFFDSSKVRILPVKVLDQCGSGANSDLAAGLAYAASHGARVANVSIQSTQGNQALEDAVTLARLSGVLVVVAAGNFNTSTAYPASYAQAMAVGALDHNDGRASYSNYGKLEISAPGGDGNSNCSCVTYTASAAACPFEIWSLAFPHAGCDACSTPGSIHDAYEGGAGTSFSTPLVAAAAALLFSQDPSRQVEDVQRILMQSAASTALGSGFNPQTGWGKLDYYNALTFQAPANVAMKAYNWPNPFNPTRDGVTTITYFLPLADAVTIRLLDAGGDLVKQWKVEGNKAYAGMNLLPWDGRNGVGAMVANGAYTLVVDSGGKRVHSTVAVLR